MSHSQGLIFTPSEEAVAYFNLSATVFRRRGGQGRGGKVTFVRRTLGQRWRNLAIVCVKLASLVDGVQTFHITANDNTTGAPAHLGHLIVMEG